MAKVRAQQVKCGLCGADNSQNLHTIRGYRIVVCNECDCIYTSPRSEFSYSGTKANLDDSIQEYRDFYALPRQACYDRYWYVLDTYRDFGRLLDIGSSFGFFLQEAQARGWRSYGVEPQSNHANWSPKNTGITVVDSVDNQELRPGRFDVIVMWDVIEHIPNVRSLIERCWDLLRPGGLLLIRTPNAEALLLDSPWWLIPYLKVYRQLVYPANPREHCYHFTPTTLRRLVEGSGFQFARLDAEQKRKEWVIVGRNQLIYLARKIFFIPLAWILNLPYEFILLVEKVE